MSSDVAGQIMLKAELSGMPECSLGMNDKALMLAADARRGKAGAVRYCFLSFFLSFPLFNFIYNTEPTALQSKISASINACVWESSMLIA